MVEHHTYHIKNHILHKDTLKRAMLLVNSKYTSLSLSALRLLRKIIGKGDESYNSHLIKVRGSNSRICRFLAQPFHPLNRKSYSPSLSRPCSKTDAVTICWTLPFWRLLNSSRMRMSNHLLHIWSRITGPSWKRSSTRTCLNKWKRNTIITVINR